MKKIITSSLVTITALSSLIGTVGVVGAAEKPTSEMKTVQLQNKADEFSAFSLYKIPNNYEKYILSTPLADGVVNNNITNNSTTIKFPALSSDVTEVGISEGASNSDILSKSSVTDGKADVDISSIKDIPGNNKLLYIKSSKAADPDTPIPVAIITKDTMSDDYSDFSYHKLEYYNLYSVPDTIKANYTLNGKITNKTTKLTFEAKGLSSFSAIDNWYINQLWSDDLSKLLSVPAIKDGTQNTVTFNIPEGYFTPLSEYDQFTLFGNTSDLAMPGAGIMVVTADQIAHVD